jgi:hypothetical protein
MKRHLIPICVFVLMTTAAAADESRIAARQAKPADAATDRSTDFPAVSQFQNPSVMPNIGCMGGEGGDPCQNDWGGGGYTQGGCNCNRNCDSVSCKPVTNNSCQSPATGSGCSDCISPNC